VPNDNAPVVVVTRAAEQSSGLTKRLHAAGYRVLEVPVIEIVDAADDGEALASALARLAAYDWLVLTSPNGASRVRGALAAMRQGSGPGVAVVGPGTAEALGRPADLQATNSVGEGLVECFPGGNGRVLLVQAEAARPVVRDGLAAKGWTVDAVIAYRTVPAKPAPVLLEQASRADAVVFTSGSTVRNFLLAAGSSGLPRVSVSIGPETTDVAEALGVRIDVTARAHTLDGVVEALRSAVDPRGPYSQS
jgi:uroporphyrinogen III methyltransferase/synthase